MRYSTIVTTTLVQSSAVYRCVYGFTYGTMLAAGTCRWDGCCAIAEDHHPPILQPLFLITKGTKNDKTRSFVMVYPFYHRNCSLHERSKTFLFIAFIITLFFFFFFTMSALFFIKDTFFILILIFFFFAWVNFFNDAIFARLKPGPVSGDFCDFAIRLALLPFSVQPLRPFIDGSTRGFRGYNRQATQYCVRFISITQI